MEKNYWLLLKRHKDYLPSIYEFTLKNPLKPIKDFLILMITANTGRTMPVLTIGKLAIHNRKNFVRTSDTEEKIINLAYDKIKKTMSLHYRYGKYRLEMSVDHLAALEHLIDWVKVRRIILGKTEAFPDSVEMESFIHRLNKKFPALLCHDD